MSKIRFDVYTWIQRLPSAAYSFNGYSVQGGTEILLKVTPVNDNIPSRPCSHMVTFSVSRWLLAFILMVTSMVGLAFTVLLIFFFTHS